jgi:transposase
MKTVVQNKDSAVYLVLYMAIELSQNKWKLGFSNGERNRIRTIDARDWIYLLTEIEIAKQKLNCSSECRVLSCYEAGRDGFWIHLALVGEGIDNKVIDSASIEVSR